jgi:hypothetical protein
MPKKFAPLPAKDLAVCLNRFREQIRAFEAWDRPAADHPFFGPISYEQWREIHLIHMAHHLGFLVPVSSPEQEKPA